MRASALVEPLDLPNVLDVPEAEREQTRHLAALAGPPLASPSMRLVTHRDNVAPLPKIVTREGDIVVAKPRGRGNFSAVGRIPAGALRD